MKILVHIGLHKTATTWLQSNFFSGERHRAFRYLVKKDAVKDFFVHPAPFHFNASQVRKQLLEAYGSRSDQRCRVISAERLSGSPHAGAYDAQIPA